MQDKTTQLGTKFAKTSLKIGNKKTHILRTNTSSNIPILLEEEQITEVESFKYLGSIIDKLEGADVDEILMKARAIFHLLKTV